MRPLRRVLRLDGPRRTGACVAGGVVPRAGGLLAVALAGCLGGCASRAVGTESDEGVARPEAVRVLGVRPWWEPAVDELSVVGVACNDETGPVLAAYDDGTLRVWESPHGSSARTYATRKRIAGVELDADGARCFVVAECGEVLCWDWRRDSVVWRAHVCPEVGFARRGTPNVVGVAFDRNRGALLVVRRDGRVFRVDVASGSVSQAMHVGRARDGYVVQAAGSDRGDCLLIATRSGDVVVVDLEGGGSRTVCERPYVVKRHDGPFAGSHIAAIDVDPSGTFVAAGASDGWVRVWRRETGALEYVVRGPDVRIRTLGFTGHGGDLVVGGMFTGLRWVVSGDLRAAEGVEGSWEAPPHAAACGPIYCVRRIVGRDLLLGGGSGGTVGLWDPRSRAPAGGWFAHWGAVTAVCVDRSRARVVTGGTDGNVVVWDARSGRASASVHVDAWVGCLAYSEERALAVAGNTFGEVVLVDADVGRVVRRWRAHWSRLNDLAFTRGGRQVVTVGSGGDPTNALPRDAPARGTALRVWDCDLGRMVREVGPVEGDLARICMADDDTAMVVVGSLGPITLRSIVGKRGMSETLPGHPTRCDVWSLGRGERQRELELPFERMPVVGWDPRRRSVAISRGGGEIWFVDMEQGAVSGRLDVGAGFVRGIDASSSERGVWVALADGEVRLLDRSDGRCLARVELPYGVGPPDETISGGYVGLANGTVAQLPTAPAALERRP